MYGPGVQPLYHHHHHHHMRAHLKKMFKVPSTANANMAWNQSKVTSNPPSESSSPTVPTHVTMQTDQTDVIDMSTVRSALSTALQRFQDAIHPIVCDRDRDLPPDCRLATVLAFELAQSDWHNAHLRILDPKSIRPRDAAAYLTKLITHHVLTTLGKYMAWLTERPTLVQSSISMEDRRADARKIMDFFVQAGAANEPLPEYWADRVAERVEWVECLLSDYGFSDSLLTDTDRDRLTAAVHACALAMAMMRVVHPNLAFAWVRPGVLESRQRGSKCLWTSGLETRGPHLPESRSASFHKSTKSETVARTTRAVHLKRRRSLVL